ncbi:MAG: DUF1822 family protein [Coleofasciculaceae cyanobacterium SM2_1_6]|nr:DUF1822 family protein [Coleofasciculaceae cyanobacterium SM2_1_6]
MSASLIFWETFDFDRGDPLKYARTTLVLRLEERFTKHHSDYGLLLITPNKYLEEDLRYYGCWGNQLSQHLAVVVELKKIGVELPRVRKIIQEPTPIQLEKIAQAYQNLSGENLTSQQIKKILSQCIAAIKSRQIKISNPSPEKPDPWELQLSTPEEESGHVEYDEDLNSPEYTQIFAPILKELIAELDSDILLILSYGFVKINQELIGTILSISQYTVSRYVDRIRDDLQAQLRKELLDRFASYPSLNIRLLDKQCMKKSLLPWYYRYWLIPEQLGVWLRSHPESLYSLTLLSTYFSDFSVLSKEDIDKLKYETTEARLSYLIKITQKKLDQNLPKAAQKLGITQPELVARVKNLSAAGVNHLSSWLGDRYGLTADFLKKIKINLEQAVFVFFTTAPYALLAQNLPEPPIVKVLKNILSKQIFSKSWLSIPTDNLDPSKYRNALRFYWTRTINQLFQVANYSYNLLIGFEEKTNSKYLVQVRVYAENKQEYLPENLELLILDDRGNIMMQVKSKEHDNWIQVELRGSLQEEFQVRVQLEQASITENFVI